MWIVELWKFIFSDFWIWLGTVILFESIFGNPIIAIVKKGVKNVSRTESN